MRIHKTKYANRTNEELIALVEPCVDPNKSDPMLIELLERLKEAVDEAKS